MKVIPHAAYSERAAFSARVIVAQPRPGAHITAHRCHPYARLVALLPSWLGGAALCGPVQLCVRVVKC